MMMKFEGAQDHEQSISKLVNKIKELQSEKNSIFNELEEFKSATKVLQKELVRIQAEVESKNKDIKHEQLLITNILEAEHKKIIKIRDLEQQNQQLSNQNQQLAEQISELQSQLRNSLQDFEKYKATYADTVPRYEMDLIKNEHDSYKERFEQQREQNSKLVP